MWPGQDRRTYICIPCRFVCKSAGQCPLCRDTLRRMSDFKAPKKKDDKGWEKVKLWTYVVDGDWQMCDWECCVPWRGDFNSLTTSQYKAMIRKRLTHWREQGFRYYEYSNIRYVRGRMY